MPAQNEDSISMTIFLKIFNNIGTDILSNRVRIDRGNSIYKISFFLNFPVNFDEAILFLVYFDRNKIEMLIFFLR